MYKNRVDLQRFISLQEDEEYIIGENLPEKDELTTFAKLVYLQITLLNNRGVILHSLGKIRDAEMCLEIAQQQRNYDVTLDEEKSKRHFT